MTLAPGIWPRPLDIQTQTVSTNTAKHEKCCTCNNERYVHSVCEQVMSGGIVSANGRWYLRSGIKIASSSAQWPTIIYIRDVNILQSGGPESGSHAGVSPDCCHQLLAKNHSAEGRREWLPFLEKAAERSNVPLRAAWKSIYQSCFKSQISKPVFNNEL